MFRTLALAVVLFMTLGLSAALANDGPPPANFDLADLQRRADAGEVQATAVLADLYLAGKWGVVRDEAKAVKLFKAAAAKGGVEAMFMLGASYQHGVGVARNPTEALKWFRQAAELGDPQAMGVVGQANFRNDPIEAVRWLRKGDALGDGRSSYLLSLSYSSGIGVATDMDEAERLRLKAKALGFPQQEDQPHVTVLPPDPVKIAAAKAHADRVIADAGAAGVFTNISIGAASKARHDASGLVCMLSPSQTGDAVDVIRVRAEEVSCEDGEATLATTLMAAPAAPDATPEDELVRWSAALQATDRTLRPAAAADIAAVTAGRPTPRFAEIWLKGPGDQSMTRLSVAVINGWIYRERISSKTFMWTIWPTGMHFSVLAKALPRKVIAAPEGQD